MCTVSTFIGKEKKVNTYQQDVGELGKFTIFEDSHVKYVYSMG
jgi:hypothetical protein